MIDKGNASILATIELVVVGVELKEEETNTPTKPRPSPNLDTHWSVTLGHETSFKHWRLVDNESVITSAASETPSPIPPPKDKETSLSAIPWDWLKEVAMALLVTPKGMRTPVWLLSVHQSSEIKFVDISQKLIKIVKSKEFLKYKYIRPKNVGEIIKLQKYVISKTNLMCI